MRQRFWATGGSYINKSVLYTFIEHLGNTLDDDVAETMKKNAVEAEESEVGDMSALAAAYEVFIEGVGYQVDSDMDEAEDYL